jgi:hypothetical protein
MQRAAFPGSLSSFDAFSIRAIPPVRLGNKS